MQAVNGCLQSRIIHLKSPLTKALTTVNKYYTLPIINLLNTIVFSMDALEIQSVLKDRLTSCEVHKVDENTISITNEAFNWMQTDVIREVCSEFGLSMAITYNGKRPHDCVEITLFASPLVGERYKNLRASNGLFF